MLLAAGHKVVGVDAGLFSAKDDGGDAVPGFGRDIRDIGPASLEGFDAVVHRAALSNDPMGELDPEVTHEISRLDASLRWRDKQ